ncbi:MAG: hypothetical protein ACK4FF_02145 [Limnobacter sp.]|uniref:hypothetical protein n=1 Tax=Limnobacter sp. TaxID=2003368 RepID=UPI00391B471C
MNNSALSQQLSELRRTRYAQVPRLRYVMQAFLPSAKHLEAGRLEARTRVLDWARTKWPGLIPPFAYDGNAFEHDQAGLRIAATSNSDGTIWAFRSEHLDSEESRTWVTEALVANLGETDAFGVRNSCSTLGGDQIPATSPRFLRDFIAHLSLVDAGFPVTATSHLVGDPETLQKFLSLLCSSDRVLPVIVLTQLPETTAYALDPAKLARDTQGLAHVFCLPASQTFSLSDAVGKMLSVFHGAVRTYYPGFSLNSDPHQHHLVFPQRIAEWSDDYGTGAVAFGQFLSRQLHTFSVGKPTKIEQLPSYFSIRRALLEKPNKTTGEEIQALRLDLEVSRANEEAWKTQALDSDAEARGYEDENRNLKAQNHTLAHELKKLREARGDTVIPTPTSYADIQRWIDSYFSDRLTLHGRAIRGLKEALFEDVTLVCNSLRLLASAYWDMRANHDPEQRQILSQKWEDGVKNLRLEYNHQSISPNRLGEFRSTYTIDYRIGQSPQQILGPHLKFGSTKDDRFCMRIYFLWDDDRQLVVIGSLPAHLETRAS